MSHRPPPHRARQIADEIQEHDGGWMIALWDRARAQWIGHSPSGARGTTGYCYSYGRTLAGLAGVGVTVYRSRASAIRALDPPTEPAECSRCQAATDRALDAIRAAEYELEKAGYQ